ncbi:galactitol-1-phosphate 5-dehydrogenase, partial [Salmonella enterica subsp. enterica serovar Wilhelmsburg]
AVAIPPQQLELAKARGATHTSHRREMTAGDIQTALSDIQFDQLVLETAGTPQTVSLAIEIAGPRAQLARVGAVPRALTQT